MSATVLPLSPERTAAVEAALGKACARIDREFGEGAIIARHKQMARTALRGLAGELGGTAVYAFARRYGDLAERLPAEFDAALRAVETMLAAERTLHRRYAAGAWFARPSRTRLAVLSEYRLMLRWLRRHGHGAVYAAAVDVMTRPLWARAAAE